MRLALAAVLAFFAFPAFAFELSGRFEQGGIALGRAAPGSAVRLDGRAVPVDSMGRFLLGFGQEAAAVAVLEVDGERRELAVAPRDWPVQRIDGLPPAKVTPDPAALVRIKAEAALIAERRAAISPESRFLGGLVAPADGPVSGVFGSRRILNGEPRAPHSGTDIAAPVGAPVRSVGDGVVTLAHPDMVFTGLTVMVDHGLGLQTVYAHLSRAEVSEGQRVAAGQVIGAVGASGRATGPHLHWGASWLDVRLDPETVMAVLAKK
ncbi:M23 family metallopeptidase [Magnetospirillum sp. UT-4]|uniref:M23 family metallopeptidase n=1 Tax=Magnetospirillum sp. UT-4 TaxID=2681467 RepID=UPI00138498CF|nr:M23 family metallopeptidase [Magnetospirillum sp. UT-4]CAA7620668.1 M23/M37 family peptidase [Magnetospirillum sp. UT-4]